MITKFVPEISFQCKVPFQSPIPIQWTLAGQCKVCGPQDNMSKLLMCTECFNLSHRQCLQLPRYAYPGSMFVCAGYIRSISGIPTNALTDQLANELTSLSAQSVQPSSQATYYHALQRFVKFTEEAQTPRQIALPLEPGRPIHQKTMRMFLVWAKDKFAMNTIQFTLSALHDWRRSKNIVRSDPELALIQSTVRQVQVLLRPLGLSVQ